MTPSFWDLITRPFPVLNSAPSRNELFDYGDGDRLFLAVLAIKATEQIFHSYYAFLLSSLPASMHLQLRCLNNLPLLSSIMLLHCREVALGLSRQHTQAGAWHVKQGAPQAPASGSFPGPSCLLFVFMGSWQCTLVPCFCPRFVRIYFLFA